MANGSYFSLVLWDFFLCFFFFFMIWLREKKNGPWVKNKEMMNENWPLIRSISAWNMSTLKRIWKKIIYLLFVTMCARMNSGAYLAASFSTDNDRRGARSPWKRNWFDFRSFFFVCDLKWKLTGGFISSTRGG